MRVFKLFFTGDYLNEQGELAVGDIGLDVIGDAPHIEVGFLGDQRPLPGEENYWDRLYSLEVCPHHIKEANGLVIFRPWVRASAFANGAENLVAIGRAGAGYDKIDLEACTANDVVVFNAPHTLVHSTASAAMTLILALAKKLEQQERLARSGRWDRQGDMMGDDLRGKTLGIVGLGKTGAELVRLVAPFEMRVLAYSPNADSNQARALGVTLVSTLEEVLGEADFISLHCRLTERTRRMFGEREFRLMKRSAYFINVARGEIVHQPALVRALREGWIAGAGLDVFEQEPLPASDPLLKFENVILTPHWLASTRQAGRATMKSIMEGMLRVAKGGIPENVVNTEVLSRPGFQKKLSRFSV